MVLVRVYASVCVGVSASFMSVNCILTECKATGYLSCVVTVYDVITYFLPHTHLTSVIFMCNMTTGVTCLVQVMFMKIC